MEGVISHYVNSLYSKVCSPPYCCAELLATLDNEPKTTPVKSNYPVRD